MWQNKKVSMIFPTYREKDSIAQATIDCAKTGVIDEVLVINNNAEVGTTEEVDRARQWVQANGYSCQVREIFEPKQGYGSAIMCGFDQSDAYYVCVSEPDGTFVMNDVYKLLSYAEEYDVVYGSRTQREFIWAGANMWWFLRWGNWAVAKMFEILFNTNCLTDVGCTMRLIKRDQLKFIRPYLTVAGSFFGPQMMLVTTLKRVSFCQIPLNYRERIGTSSVTGDFWKAWKLGWRMIFLILEYRIAGWLKGRSYLTDKDDQIADASPKKQPSQPLDRSL